MYVGLSVTVVIVGVGVFDSVPSSSGEEHPSGTNIGKVLRRPLLGPVEDHLLIPPDFLVRSVRLDRLSYNDISLLRDDG
jgi:hypothetical protein